MVWVVRGVCIRGVLTDTIGRLRVGGGFCGVVRSRSRRRAGMRVVVCEAPIHLPRPHMPVQQRERSRRRTSQGAIIVQPSP